MPLIKCPECGKEVSDAAPVCPNCAYPLKQAYTAFPPPQYYQGPPPPQYYQGPPPPPPEPPKKKSHLTCGTLIALFIVIVVIGAVVRSCDRVATDQPSQRTVQSSSTPAAAPVAKDPPIVITAEQLYKEYNENEVKADNKFKGKSILITGTVDEISKDILDEVYVVLTVDNFLETVHVNFLDSKDPRIPELTKGTRLTLLCIGSTMIIGTPTLDDCTFQD